MDKNEIFSHIDHTQLKAFATWDAIKKLCDEAAEYHTASVCIPPNYIARVKEAYGDKINELVTGTDDIASTWDAFFEENRGMWEPLLNELNEHFGY